jgi:hypothetical protein
MSNTEQSDYLSIETDQKWEVQDNEFNQQVFANTSLIYSIRKLTILCKQYI